jgi:Spy/CpxP family protein refolding chaperone
MKTIPMLAAALLTLAGAAGAQQPAQQADDPIGQSLFQVELVMAHQGEIGLTDAQRDFIVAEVGKAQQRATDLQFKMQREVETMVTLVRQDPVNEEQVMVQLDKVLGVERDFKRVQLTLLIRIKNKLTPDQRAKLKAIRESSAH